MPGSASFIFPARLFVHSRHHDVQIQSQNSGAENFQSSAPSAARATLKPLSSRSFSIYPEASVVLHQQDFHFFHFKRLCSTTGKEAVKMPLPFRPKIGFHLQRPPWAGDLPAYSALPKPLWSRGHHRGLFCKIFLLNTFFLVRRARSWPHGP